MRNITKRGTICNFTIRTLISSLLVSLLLLLPLTMAETTVTQQTCTVTQHSASEEGHNHPLRVEFNGQTNLCYPILEATCDNDLPMVCRESDVCSAHHQSSSAILNALRRRKRKAVSEDDKERLYWKHMWNQGSSLVEPEEWRRRRRKRWIKK